MWQRQHLVQSWRTAILSALSRRHGRAQKNAARACEGEGGQFTEGNRQPTRSEGLPKISLLP